MYNSIKNLLIYNRNDAIRQFEADLNQYTERSTHRYIGDLDKVCHSQREWSADLFILRCLQSSSLSANPRSVKVLQDSLKRYKQANPDSSLTFSRLKREGWVRIVWGVWYIPFEFVVFKKHVDENSPHLYRFLKALSDIPYSDSREIVISNIEKIKEEHSRVYPATPSLESLIESEIILEKNGLLTLNPRSPYLTSFAPQILAKLWEDVQFGPQKMDERLTWWISYFELIRDGYKFLDYMNPLSRDQFLDACRDRLLKERDLIGWTEELNRIAANALSGYGKVDLDVYVSQYKLPDNEIEKLFWLERGPESAFHVDQPRERLSLLYLWIVGWECASKYVPERPRLATLLQERKNRPFFFKELRTSCYRYPAVIPWLLCNPETVELGTALLAVFRASFPGSYLDSTSQLEAERITEQLWKKGLVFAGHTIARMSEEESVSVIISLSSWLIQKARKNLYRFEKGKKGYEEWERKWNLFMEMVSSMPVYQNLKESLLIRICVPLVRTLIEKLSNTAVPITDPLFPLLLWLIQRPPLSHYNRLLIEDAMRVASDLYVKSVEHANNNLLEEVVVELITEHPAWLIISNWLQNTSCEAVKWSRFISAFQLNSELALCPDESELRNRWNRIVNVKLRMHLRLLAKLVIHWHERFNTEVPSDIAYAFELLFLDTLKKSDLFEIHPFSDSLGASLFLLSQPVEQNLLDLVGEAINELPQVRRVSLIKGVKATTQDPRILLKLYNRLTREKDRSLLFESLQLLVKTGQMTDVSWLTEVQAIVQELLNTENPELAKLSLSYLDKYETKGIKRQLSGWEEWAYRERLRAHFISGNHEAILSNFADPGDSNEKKKSLLFYQALSYLDINDEIHLRKALTMFKELHARDPLIPSYAVNWLATCVRLYHLLNKNGDAETKSKLDEIGRETIQVLELIDSSYTEEQIENAWPNIVTNRLYFYYLSGDTDDFWNFYYGLSEQMRLSLPNAKYAVRLYMDQGDWGSATELLRQMKECHGDFEEYNELLNNIQTHNNQNLPVPSPEIYVELLQKWKTISSAIANLKMLRPEEQVKAFTNRSDMSLQKFLLDTILDVCRNVIEYSPNLTPSTNQPAEEDRYTELLASLLRQRLLPLGWEVHTQSRGGYTKEISGARGGIGERDLVIRSNSGNNLMVVEALVLKNGNRANILRHIEKPFAYDTTNCNFHVLLSYGFTEKADSVWDTYKQLAINRKDGDFSVIAHGDLSSLFKEVDEQGIRAFYTENNTDIEGQTAIVIHIFADILHAKMRKIADTARAH
jgi:hypothetical protein